MYWLLIGISKESEGWSTLCESLYEFKYKGIYSKSYDRWWEAGIEFWWYSTIEENTHLRRLSSEHKLQLISGKYPELNLQKIVGDSTSATEKFWTICQGSSLPVDPSEAYEIRTDLSTMPWSDSKYYSYDTLRGSDLIKSLTDIEKDHFKALAKG